MEMTIENINTSITLQDFNDYRNLLSDFEPYLNSIEIVHFDQLTSNFLRQSSNQFYWKDINDIKLKNDEADTVDIDLLGKELSSYRKDEKFEKTLKKYGKQIENRFRFVDFTALGVEISPGNYKKWVDILKDGFVVEPFEEIKIPEMHSDFNPFDPKSYFDPEGDNVANEQALRGYFRDAYMGVLAEQLLGIGRDEEPRKDVEDKVKDYVKWAKERKAEILSKSWSGFDSVTNTITSTADMFFGPNNIYSAVTKLTANAWYSAVSATAGLFDISDSPAILSGRSRPLRKAVVTSMTAPGYTRKDVIAAIGKMGRGGDSTGAFGTKGKVEEKTDKKTGETKTIVRKGAGFADNIKLYDESVSTTITVEEDSRELCDLILSPDFQTQYFIAFFTEQESPDKPETQLKIDEKVVDISKIDGSVILSNKYNYYFYTNKFKTTPAKRKQTDLQYGAFKVKKATNTVEGNNNFSFEVEEDLSLTLRRFILEQGLGVFIGSDYYANNYIRPLNGRMSLHILLPETTVIEENNMLVHHFILQDIQFTKVSSLKFDHGSTNNSTATISGICRKILLCHEDLTALGKRYK